MAKKIVCFEVFSAYEKTLIFHKTPLENQFPAENHNPQGNENPCKELKRTPVENTIPQGLPKKSKKPCRKHPARD